MTTYLALPEAAARLGISPSALRRRLHAGTAQGEKRPTASGFAWYVEIDDAAPTPTPTPTPDAPTPERPQEDSGRTTLPVEARRAHEMAVYSQQLLAPVLARLEAQAEELGRVRNECDHLRARVAELETQTAPVPAQEQGRSWWNRLFGG